MPLPIRQVGPLQGRAPNTGGITMGSNNFAASPGMSTPMQRAPAQQDNSVKNGMAGLDMLNEAGALDPLKGLFSSPAPFAGSSMMGPGVGTLSAMAPAPALAPFAGSSMMGPGVGTLSAMAPALAPVAGSSMIGPGVGTLSAMTAGGSLAAAAPLAAGGSLAAAAPAFLGMGPLGWAALTGVGLLTAFG